MSSSLVKKALEIFDSAETDLADKNAKGEVQKTVKVKKKKVHNLKKQIGGGSQGASLIKKALKQALAKEDHTQENLEVLLSLSKEKHSKFTSRILERTSLTPAPKEIPPCDSTAFTEEDFAKFEQEYFVS